MAKKIWIHSCVGLLLLSACETTTSYQSTTALADYTWPADSLLSFSFSVQDTTQPYDIYLMLKNTQHYPYQNIYVTYYLEDSTQALCTTALGNYTLFEPKTGKPLGKGWGKVKSHTLVLLQDYYFLYPGTYTLRLAQFMRTEALAGLHAVGIKVLKASKQPRKKDS